MRFGTDGLFLGDWMGKALFGIGLLWEGLWGMVSRTGGFIWLCIGLTDEIISEDKVQSLLFHDTAIGLIRFQDYFWLLLGWSGLS